VQKVKVISLVSQKGGVGKSSIAVSLAVAAHEAGRSVVVLDADRQGTSVQWAAARQGAPPEVAAIAADKLETAISRLAASNSVDVVFVDTAGIDGPAAAVAIRLSDLCLVPTRPSAADLRAVRPTLAAILRLEKRFAFVVNQANARSFRVKDTVAGLEVLGVLAEPVIAMRAAHQDAIAAGQGVTETEPLGAAADEIRRLWSWIDSHTGGGLAHAA
jgi:chromosome partitioning protein